MHQFPKFTPAFNSTCFGQFPCPSSGVYSLYTQQWYMSYRFVDNFRAVRSWSCSKAVYKPVWHTPVPSVQRINSWWWTEELPETCRISCRSKLGKLVHLVGFITKKLVTAILNYAIIEILPINFVRFNARVCKLLCTWISTQTCFNPAKRKLLNN
jgi:hypothetical protein